MTVAQGLETGFSILRQDPLCLVVGELSLVFVHPAKVELLSEVCSVQQWLPHEEGAVVRPAWGAPPSGDPNTPSDMRHREARL